MSLPQLKAWIRYLPQLCWLAYCAGLLLSLIPYLGRSVEEMGDIALISRQVAQASDFEVLRGAYSRLGFFHIGPISFYWMALVDAILPSSLFAQHSHYYAYALAVWLMNTAMGMAAFRGMEKLNLSLAVRNWTVVALILFLWNLQGHVLFSPWGPHLTIVPFLWFSVNLVRAAQAEFNALPGLAFSSIWILHSHAGSMIFLGPSLIFLLYLWYRLHRRNLLFVSSLQWPLIGGLAILALGLAFPIIEAVRNDGGNLASIWNYLQQNDTWRKPGKSLVFMLSAMDGPASTAVPVFFPLSLVLYFALVRKRLTDSGRRLIYLVWIAVAGTFYGALRTPGVLVPHLFDHLLSMQALFLALTVAPLFGLIFEFWGRKRSNSAASQWMERFKVTDHAPMIPVAAVLFVLCFLVAGWHREARPPEDPFKASELLVRLKRIGLPAPDEGMVRIHWKQEHLPHWPRAAGLMLQMERRDYQACIEEPYDILFGPESVCKKDPELTILIEPASNNPMLEGDASIQYLEIRATIQNEKNQ